MKLIKITVLRQKSDLVFKFFTVLHYDINVSLRVNFLCLSVQCCTRSPPFFFSTRPLGHKPPPSPGPAENCIVTPLRRDRCPLGVLCAEPPVIRRAGCRNTTVIGRATGLTAQQISSLVYRQINATHLLRNHPSIARLSRHSQLSFSCRKCNRLLLKLQFVSVSWSTVLH